MRRIQFGIGIGFRQDNTPITKLESAEMIGDVLHHLGRFFGGGFITRGRGFWTSKWTNQTVVEDDITITIDTDEPDGIIKEVAEMLRMIFDQTAIHVATFDVHAWDHDALFAQEII